MKTTLLLFAALFFMSAQSFATIDTVTVQDHVFTPNTLPNVHIGDTIRWVWVNGTHTTTSTSVPTGAATWNNPINSGSTSFIYVPTVAGDYSYQCNFHFSMGMTGTFTVLSSTGVGAVNATHAPGIYPNPASDKLNVSFNAVGPATVTLTNMAGKQVLLKKFTGTKSAEINLHDIPAGNYMVRTVQGADISSHQLVVKH